MTQIGEEAIRFSLFVCHNLSRRRCPTDDHVLYHPILEMTRQLVPFGLSPQLLYLVSAETYRYFRLCSFALWKMRRWLSLKLA